MNGASQWRFEVVRQIASAFSEIPGIEAIVVGGSVATGWSDRYSDTELGVFWSELPTIEEQMAMLSRVGGRPRFGKIYPWKDPDHPGGYSPFLIGQALTQDGDEVFYPGSESGYPIEMEQVAVETAEQCLADVVDGYDSEKEKQGLLAFLQTGIPLHGRALIESWRQRIAIYPGQLAVKIIQSKLKLVRWKLWQLEIWVSRDDTLLLYREMESVIDDLLGLLSALNLRYDRSSRKWMDHEISAMRIKPADLSLRLKEGFRLPPGKGLDHLRGITAEVLGLVVKHRPEIDRCALDETLVPCWRTWEGPPERWVWE